ncbi:MAG: ABC transporter permease, partial [Clostridia bacterium]|nr:ABC transporter permease [Clostridia bacterium]
MDIKDFNFDLSLTPTDKSMLAEIADMVGTPEGAFNIRKNGEGVVRTSSENIEIKPKLDKPGIDIIIKPYTVAEKVHIPVIITESGVQEVVYNDFFIGEG